MSAHKISLRSSFYLISFFFILQSSYTFSQKPITFKETLEYLNKKFEGKCSFRDKKRYVEVTFEKGGEVYRIDKVHLAEMDADLVSYSTEEESVIARCKETFPECIEREIIRLNKIDQYFRLSLPVAGMDQKSIEGVREALVHLIKLVVYSDHERTAPFEQVETGKR